MKIYTQIKKLAPICAIFGALALVSCNEEEEEGTTETPPAAEETTAPEGSKGTE